MSAFWPFAHCDGTSWDHGYSATLVWDPSFCGAGHGKNGGSDVHWIFESHSQGQPLIKASAIILNCARCERIDLADFAQIRPPRGNAWSRGGPKLPPFSEAQYVLKRRACASEQNLLLLHVIVKILAEIGSPT
jgi:hypothetical protein